MTALKASIVVPSRGAAARLPFLFDALGAQADPSWEAIIVVDGDVDDSADVIDAVRDELPVTGKSGAEAVFVPELETPHHIAAVTTEIRVKRAFYSGGARQAFASMHGTQVVGEYQGGTGAWGKLIDRTSSRNGLSALLTKHAGPTRLSTSCRVGWRRSASPGSSNPPECRASAPRSRWRTMSEFEQLGMKELRS